MLSLSIPRELHHRINVDAFHRMADAGILNEADRVELIEGELVDMVPIGSRHAAVVARLINTLAQRVEGSAIVQAQNPLVLGNHSEPEPDVMLLRPRADYYADAHPCATDVLLLVEVAESSLEYDRAVKLPLYAAHGVSEVWLVNLHERVLEVYCEPDGESREYRLVSQMGTGALAPKGLDRAEIEVAEILL